MEQHTFKNAINCLNTTIYSFLEIPGDQSSNLYLNVVHFFNIIFKDQKKLFYTNFKPMACTIKPYIVVIKRSKLVCLALSVSSSLA
jgi:hypothetical protein